MKKICAIVTRHASILCIAVSLYIPGCSHMEPEEYICTEPERLDVGIGNVIDLTVGQSGNPNILTVDGAYEFRYSKQKLVSLDLPADATGITYSPNHSSMIFINADGIISDEDHNILYNIKELSNPDPDFIYKFLAVRNNNFYTLTYSSKGMTHSDGLMRVSPDGTVKLFYYASYRAAGFEVYNDSMYYLMDNGQLTVGSAKNEMMLHEFEIPYENVAGIACIGDCMFIYDNDSKELIKIKIPGYE